MADYSLLNVRLPKKWWFRYKFLKYSARLVDRFPLLGKASRYIGYRFVNFANSGKSYKVHPEYVDLLKRDDEDANRPGSPYGYEDLWEIRTVLNYHNQLRRKDFEMVKGWESPFVYREAIKAVSEILKKDPEVHTMLDFGVAFGYLNSVLAKEFKDRQFIGVDRSPFVKFYNDHYFGDIKNLSFYAGDVFELLRQKDLKNGMLFHARTVVCLPPGFAKKLYRAAFQAGIQYVVGVEQVGVSRQTDQFYEFSDSPKESVFFRDFMYIHNYPGLLRECGYEIQDIDLVNTNSPYHQDFRLLRLVAKRVR